MNLNQIAYFMETAKRLNFTEAAKALYIAQPSLSKQISLLEEEIGVRLFERNRREVRLTAAGELMWKEFQVIFQDIETALENVRRAGAGTDTIRIGFFNSFNFEFVREKIERQVRSCFPESQWVVENYDLKQLHEFLEQDRLDIVVTFAYELSQYGDVCWGVLDEFKRCVICARQTDLGKKGTFDAELLSESVWVHLDEKIGRGIYQHEKNAMKKLGIRNCEERGYSNIFSVINQVKMGHGFAFLDPYLAEQYPKLLKAITLPEEEPVRVVAVCRREKYEKFRPVLELCSRMSEEKE